MSRHFAAGRSIKSDDSFPSYPLLATLKLLIDGEEMTFFFTTISITTDNFHRHRELPRRPIYGRSAFERINDYPLHAAKAMG
jgi:hypothetical protein